jgi:hypothetical protein
LRIKLVSLEKGSNHHRGHQSGLESNGTNSSWHVDFGSILGGAR